MTISNKATISKSAVIHDDVEINDGVIIHDNVVIYPNTIIGKGTEIFDGAVLGRIPKPNRTITREINPNLGPLEIGEDCIIGVNVILYTGTRIGRQVLLGDLCWIREECFIDDFAVMGAGTEVHYNSRIGKRARIYGSSIVAGNSVIEEDVFFGPHVVMIQDNTLGRKGYSKDWVGATVKRGAGIGGNATLLYNIIIGEDSIVAAGSVVTKDVPSRKVAMGSPARIVKDVPPELLPRR